MVGQQQTSFSDRAARGGIGLEVANAIRSYLDRADGDLRLALALSVADRLSTPRPLESGRQAAWRRTAETKTAARVGGRS